MHQWHTTSSLPTKLLSLRILQPITRRPLVSWTVIYLPHPRTATCVSHTACLENGLIPQWLTSWAQLSQGLPWCCVPKLCIIRRPDSFYAVMHNNICTIQFPDFTCVTCSTAHGNLWHFRDRPCNQLTIRIMCAMLPRNWFIWNTSQQRRLCF